MKAHKYGEIDGVRNFTDSFIMSIWDRIETEKKAEYVNRTSENWGREDFLRSVKSDKLHLWIIFYDKKLFAIVWVQNIKGKRAEMHFCTFNGFPRNIVEYGREVQDFLMNFYEFEVVYGFTPADNKLALKYLDKLGWVRLGVLPRGSYSCKAGNMDSILMYRSRI